MRALDADIWLAARSDAKVLITGESGVGKEVTARLIHRRSRRNQMPLVAINCAGLPDTLLESELFGYVRGSFTGAYRDKPGLLELAKNGTFFLDEVGEMSLRMQALLLRFLETGEIQRLGADHRTTHVDVRVISATNRQLEGEIAGGGFRTDLFYRLNVIQLKLPALRERRDDIPAMLDHFARTLALQHRMAIPDIPADLVTRFVEYDWPGNVRELKNVVERLVVRCGDGSLRVADLPEPLRPSFIVTGASALETADTPGGLDIVNRLYEEMVQGGVSFWQAVYAPFSAHDITRSTLRAVVSRGLGQTRGRYSELTTLFNMDRKDYKRFLSFLKKHSCLVPFHQFRTPIASTDPVAENDGPDDDFRPKVA